MSPNRFVPHLLAALLVLVSTAGNATQPLSASLLTPSISPEQPVVLQFSRPLSKTGLDVSVSPRLPLKATVQGKRLEIQSAPFWQPETSYRLRVSAARSSDGSEQVMSALSFSFSVTGGLQARLGGEIQYRDSPPALGPEGVLSASFDFPMDSSTIHARLDGNPLAELTWSEDKRTFTAAPPSLTPYTQHDFTVESAVASNGRPLAQPVSLQFTAWPELPVEPAETQSAAVPSTPLLVVVSNAPEARPQSGLQQADMVFEYLSEYKLSRFSAVYFGNPPPVIGPVRSCREINLYLGFALRADSMCSGASDGTLALIWRSGLPVLIDDYDKGGHFYRIPWRFRPHNLYTDATRAQAWRDSSPQPAGNYFLARKHVAPELSGQPSQGPTVSAHSTRWEYDPVSGGYHRYDQDRINGGPDKLLVDQESKQPLVASTVVVMHVKARDAGWVEDLNGGAHSVWYEMPGSGPVEIYAGGQRVEGQWHFGDPGQDYRTMQQVPWFTDAQGGVVRLANGLTWVHVVGDL